LDGFLDALLSSFAAVISGRALLFSLLACGLIVGMVLLLNSN